MTACDCRPVTNRCWTLMGATGRCSRPRDHAGPHYECFILPSSTDEGLTIAHRARTEGDPR